MYQVHVCRHCFPAWVAETTLPDSSFAPVSKLTENTLDAWTGLRTPLENDSERFGSDMRRAAVCDDWNSRLHLIGGCFQIFCEPAAKTAEAYVSGVGPRPIHGHAKTCIANTHLKHRWGPVSDIAGCLPQQQTRKLAPIPTSRLYLRRISYQVQYMRSLRLLHLGYALLPAS